MSSQTDPTLEQIPDKDLQQILGRIAESLVTAVSADNVFVYWAVAGPVFQPVLACGMLLETDRATFSANSLDPDTDMLAHEMVSGRVSIISNRVQGDARIVPSILTALHVDTAIAIPVVNRKKLIGMVVITRLGRYEPFTVFQVRVAEAIVGAIALTLQNEWLYRRARTRLEESRSLHQVTLSLLQKLELEEVLEIVCDEAQGQIGADGGSIALLDGDDWLMVMYAAGETPVKPGRLRAEDCPQGVAARRGETLLLNETAGVGADPSLSGPFSLLEVPLLVQGEPIGVLELADRQRGFTLDDVRLIQLFANEAAIAVENARLARKAQEMAVLEERHRLSRELHDSVNQLLYAMALYTNAAQKQLDQGDLDAVRQHLANLGESAHEALNEMRLLIYELRPQVLDQLGLQEALAQRLKSVEERLGLEASFKWRVNSALDSKVEEALYGVAQEALNNAIKHSKARNVSVHVVQSGHTIVLKIEDDGVGFDLAAVDQGKIGLKSMQERAVSLGGRLEILTSPGGGTSIMVEVNL